jgi:hypothetical protein
MVKHYKTVQLSHTGVNDTNKEFLTGVNYIGIAPSASDNDTGQISKQMNNSSKILKQLKSFLGISIGPGGIV